MAFTRAKFGSVVRILAAMFVLVTGASVAQGQCGANVARYLGGEFGAVAQVTSNRLAVGHGNVVELYQSADPLSPQPMSPPRRMGLEAPAVKIAMTMNGPRMGVLRADGRITIGTVSYSPSVSVGFPVTIGSGDYVDIAVDGHFVYAAGLVEVGFISSWLDIYDDTSGSPVRVSRVYPLIDTYGYDKVVKVGNILWCAMHEHESSLLGIEGWDVSNPAAPVRVTASLSNSTLGTFTRISAMAHVNGRLLLSYRRDSFDIPLVREDWMRAVDIANPASPVWHPPVDLNGFATAMAADGTRLRIAIENSGVGTWETFNPAALTWLGAYFNSAWDVGQIVCIGGTDYWAAGAAGLRTMNQTNPAAPSERTYVQQIPLRPNIMRQRGSISATLDTATDQLRFLDYSLPEGQENRGSIVVPTTAYGLELGELSGGAIGLACVWSLGNPNDSITIIDITNPASAVTRSTITGFGQANMFAVSGSRLYIHTTTNDLRIYELAVPAAPQLRSTTPFGGFFYDFTCMTAWNNALAMGNFQLGLWIIDTTNATAPLVSTVYSPVTGYKVHSIVKSPNYLFVSASVNDPGDANYTTRLESLNVNNVAAVTRRFVHTTNLGFGPPPVFDEMSIVSGPAGKFLIGLNGRYFGHVDQWDGLDNEMFVYSLPAGFLTGEAVPFPIDQRVVPCASGKVAASADGSSFYVPGNSAGVYHFATPTQWRAGWGLVTHDTHACYNGSITLVVFPSAIELATIEWYFDAFGAAPPVLLTSGPTAWGSNVFVSTDGTGITIDTLRRQDARGTYYAKATNSCGSTYAFFELALCTPDFNCSGALTVQDVFDLLTAWFNASPAADYNGVGGTTIQDIFDFLTDWFLGC